ncbi:MAG: LiaI-LiaF-like domain-containing protein [Candidatus Limnocylindria bacterium]
MTDQSSDPTTRVQTAAPATAPPTPPAPPPAGWAAPATRRDDGRRGSALFGIVLVGIGLWFFASETLGLDMPDIRWRQAWPVILIVVGAWILLGQLRRRR